jgi:hypothetical protein
MSVARVQYAERKVLSSADLNDEQAYLVQMRRKHWLWAHGWGIVQGLKLVVIEGDLVLQAGAAVDGYARELYVPKNLVIPESIFADLFPASLDTGNERVLDFWLRYSRSPLNGRNDRWEEEAVLCATRAKQKVQDQWIDVVAHPRRPPSVPAGDLAQVPGQEPADDPGRAWPVYLGRVSWLKIPPSLPVVDETVQRVYTTLVGEKVASVSRQFVKEDPKNPSLVPPPPVSRAELDFTANQPGRPAFSIRVAASSGSVVDRLALWRGGTVTFTGHSSVLNDLAPDKLALAGMLGKEESEKVNNLCLGQSQFSFSADQIANPACMLTEFMTGRVPLAGYQQNRVRGEILKYLEDPQVDLAAFLADRVLNTLMAGRWFIFEEERLRQIPLRSETWRMIRTWPKGADYRPLNWQVLAETLMDAFVPGLAFNSGHALVIGRLAEAPKAARPWQVYRLEQQTEEGETNSQLQFEIEDPGDKDEPSLYQLAVGMTRPQPKPAAGEDAAVQKAEEIYTGSIFHACLVVDAACTVTVRGDLLVEGRLVRSPVPADPEDPRFVGQLVDGWMQGASAANLAGTALDVSGLTLEAEEGSLEWSYTFYLKNNSLAEIKQVEVIDTYAINEVRSQTVRTAVADILTPGATMTVPITHKEEAALVKDSRIGLSFTVQGSAPGGMAVFCNRGLLGTVRGKPSEPM